MKQGSFLYKFLLVVFIFCLSQAAAAQDAFISFENGTLISIKTEFSKKERNKRLSSFSDSENSGANIVHRIMIDPNSRRYFGYDLEITPLKDEKKFRVFVKALSIEPDFELLGKEDLVPQSIPKFPDEFFVDDGDTIILVLLENEETGEKVSDLIKITFRKKGAEPLPVKPRDSRQ